MNERIVKTATGLAAVASFLTLAGTAMADINTKKPQLQLADVVGKGIELKPYAAAVVLGRNPDGSFIIGEKVLLPDTSNFGPAYPPAVYDNWGGDIADPGVCSADPTVITPANGALSGGYGIGCDFGLGCDGSCNEGGQCAPGLRWFFGTTAAWSGDIHQMQALAPNTSGVVSYIKNGWFQAFGSDTGLDACGNIYTETVVVVNVYNNIVGDQIGTDVLDTTELGDNFKDGVALFFGAIGSGGWFNATADLRGAGDPTLFLGDVDPVAGGDAIEIAYADTDPFDPTILVRRQYGQSMLWGQGDTTQQGSNSPVYYLDGSLNTAGTDPECANVPDGAYLQPGGGTDPTTDDDFVDGTGLCPDSIAPMIGLFGDPSGNAEICPDSASLLAGVTINGTDPTMACGSDDITWDTQSTTFAAVFSPAPIQAAFVGFIDPNGGGTMLTFTVEGHPQLGAGSAFLQIQVFNFTTGSFELSPPFINQPDGPPDAIYSFTVDNTNGDYNDITGEVNARFTAAKTNPGPVRMIFDSVFWSVN